MKFPHTGERRSRQKRRRDSLAAATLAAIRQLLFARTANRPAPIYQALHTRYFRAGAKATLTSQE